MTQKTQKELLAEKRAAALRENLKRRKAAQNGTAQTSTTQTSTTKKTEQK
jgi:hypothetical protein